MKKALSYLVMVPLAFCAGLNYVVFVFPNDFAPAGVDGVCTMIQYLLSTNMGYLSLIINVPLLIASWFLISKEFVVKSTVFTLSFSLSVILLEKIDLSAIIYKTDNSVVFAPVFGGLVRGLLYVATLGAGGSSGGIDIIAVIIKKYKPEYSLMNVIFVMNACIAVAAYFVYGFNLEPSLCSLVYAFITSASTKYFQKRLKKESKESQSNS